jgi:hypothetical protein
MYVYITYTEPLSVQAQYSRLCPIISSSCYNIILVTWTVVCLTTAKFKPSYVSCVVVRLVRCCEHFRYHHFIWLLLVACIILLYNHICTSVLKLCANREPVPANKSKPHCKWRSVSQSVSQSVSLGIETHLGFMTRYVLLFDSYGLVFVERPLWREGGSVFLYMLLALASAVFLESESFGTHDHILLSQIWDFPFVVSYDSQGHGGGIRPRLYTGVPANEICCPL